MNDVAIRASFIPDPTEPYRVLANIATDRVNIAVVGGGLTSYRPLQSSGGYEPFARTRVSEIDEQDPQLGPGIRVNSDDDNDNGLLDRVEEGTVLGENDLIELVIKRPELDGVELALQRSNGFAAVWSASNRTVALPFDETTNQTEVIEFGNQDEKTVWVELVGHGTNTFDLSLKAVATDIQLDTVTFHRFTSIVVVLGGEDFPWNELPDVDTNPYPTDGIWSFANGARNSGYDVVQYDEDLINTRGRGRAYDDVANAVNHQHVNNVSIHGYSHGGGSAYGLSWRLNQNVVGTLSDITKPFSVPYTSYIDAITDWATGSEQRRPLLTQFHTNQYQHNWSWGLNGDALDPLSEDDIDRTYLGVNHTTIDNNPLVLELMRDRLLQKVPR